MGSQLAVVWGLLLPESTLDQQWFRVLAGFVAVNMLVYVMVSVARAVPRPAGGDRRPRRHARGETRSIHPDGPR